MTPIDDLQLSQRLRALRVDPPQTGFEARLAERLRSERPEPAPAPRSARVIVGPWLRRGPVRLIGATALFVAGAAAAVEGGVVEWVQARVQAARHVEAVEAPAAAPNIRERAPARRERAVERPAATIEAAPEAAPGIEVTRAAELPARREPVTETAATVPRLAPERHIERARDSVAAPERRVERARDAEDLPERRPRLDLPVVPRLEIDPQGRARHPDADTRLGRGLSKPEGGPGARERGPDLERIRDIAKARRERAEGNERPRVDERVRERRERINSERRDNQERGRRDRQIR